MSSDDERTVRMARDAMESLKRYSVSDARIKAAFSEYKAAQIGQVIAIHEAEKASRARTTSLIPLFMGKAASCRADSNKELAMARVFEAAAELVSALEDAGFVSCEATGGWC